MQNTSNKRTRDPAEEQGATADRDDDLAGHNKRAAIYPGSPEVPAEREAYLGAVQSALVDVIPVPDLHSIVTDFLVGSSVKVIAQTNDGRNLSIAMHFPFKGTCICTFTLLTRHLKPAAHEPETAVFTHANKSMLKCFGTYRAVERELGIFYSRERKRGWRLCYIDYRNRVVASVSSPQLESIGRFIRDTVSAYLPAFEEPCTSHRHRRRPDNCAARRVVQAYFGFGDVSCLIAFDAGSVYCLGGNAQVTMIEYDTIYIDGTPASLDGCSSIVYDLIQRHKVFIEGYDIITYMALYR